MKKRLIRFGAGLILLVFCGLVLSRNVLFPPTLSRELAALAPSDPLLFIQGSHLRAHLDQFMQRSEYADLLNSELLSSLNQTDWWPDFRENFQDFRKSLIIDPLHIVGHETALAVYASERGEVLPRAILIGKTDRVARVAERLMVGYERVAHQIGITPSQPYRQHAVYVLQTYDMLWPLYYAVVGEAGLIATSLPLLYETIDVITAQTSQPATVFTRAYPVAVPQNRVLAGYIDTAGFSEECRRNPLLRALGLGQGYAPGRPDPHAVFTVTAGSNQLSAQIHWFATAQAAAQVGPELLARITDWKAVLPRSLSQPMILAGNLPRMQALFHAGQQVFPGWPLNSPAVDAGVYGERWECVVSNRLLGLLYTLPETACLLDTADVPASQRALTGLAQTMLIESLPALLQSRVTMGAEAYRSAEIASIALKMPLVTQQIAHYAAVPFAPAASPDAAAAAGYTTISNSLTMLKHQLDTLADHSKTTPYQLDEAFSHTGFLAVLSPTHVADLLKNLSQTATFALVVPPDPQSAARQALPLIEQGLRLLPTITVAGEAVAGQVVLDVRLHP